MLQPINTAHLSALDSELATLRADLERVKAQRDRLRDALADLMKVALRVDIYKWAEAIDQTNISRPCDAASKALAACRD